MYSYPNRLHIRLCPRTREHSGKQMSIDESSSECFVFTDGQIIFIVTRDTQTLV